MSKRNVQKWRPKVTSKNGVQKWLPKVTSKNNFQKWYTKLHKKVTSKSYAQMWRPKVTFKSYIKKLRPKVTTKCHGKKGPLKQCVLNVFFGPINILIYLWPPNSMKLWTNEYICPEIFEYLSIFKYIQCQNPKH